LKEWTAPDSRITPSNTNLEEEEIVDDPGNDGNASMPEQIKRPNPWRKMMMVSTVKPIRCTIVSNLFYFGMTLYMFRTVFPSIISSSRLYIQLSNRYCCMYSLELLIMGGKTV